MDAPVAPIPIERLEVGLVLVPVRSPDGDQLWFILDTGAGITVLSPATAARLPVETGRTIEAQAVGGTVPLVLGELAELRVGDAVLVDLDVAVLELPAEVREKLGRPIDGILGRSFFDAVDLELDLQAGELALLPPGTLRRERAEPGVPFKLRGGTLLVRAELGETRLPAIVDFGANRSLVNRTIAEATGGTIVPSVGVMQGADGQPLPLAAQVTTRLRLGEVDVGELELDVCEDVQCGELLGRRGREAQLGVHVVEGFTVGLSYRDRRLWLERQ